MKSTKRASDSFPISLSLGGTPIGAARALELEERTGTFHLAGLDFIARVFFAERVGPGGPERTTLEDLCLSDRGRQRTMRVHRAMVQHFSAGTGDLELSGSFESYSPPPLPGDQRGRG